LRDVKRESSIQISRRPLGLGFSCRPSGGVTLPRCPTRTGREHDAADLPLRDVKRESSIQISRRPLGRIQ
jgi:hypothetical protein